MSTIRGRITGLATAAALTAGLLTLPAVTAHATDTITCGGVTMTVPDGTTVTCVNGSFQFATPNPGSGTVDPTPVANSTDLRAQATADAESVLAVAKADLKHINALVTADAKKAYKTTRDNYLAKKGAKASKKSVQRKARKVAAKARKEARGLARHTYGYAAADVAVGDAQYCLTILDFPTPWTSTGADRCVWFDYLNADTDPGNGGGTVDPTPTPTPNPTPTPGGGEDKVATSISDLTIPAGAPQKPATTKTAAKAMMKTYYPSMFDRERPELWSTGETILDDFAYASERGGKARLYRTADPRVAIFVMDYTDLAGVRHLEFRVVSGDFRDSLTVEGVTVKDFAASLTATWSPKLPPSAIEHGILYATPVENVALVGYAAGDTPGVDESIGVDERGRGGWAHLEKGRN